MAISDTLLNKLFLSISTLNKLSNILSEEDIDISDIEQNNIISSLDKLSSINSIIDDLTDEDDEDDSQEDENNPLPDIFSDYMYGIGETCLLLDPFDNYRIFTLYTDYDKKTYLDISDGQTLYIVFRQGSKEIRIPEYKDYGNNITIDKTLGQVLFKITKKQVSEIISLKSKEFYITRIYETYNSIDDSIVSSDEEVIFSGYWGERNSNKESKYLETIKNLQNLIDQKEAALQSMVDAINTLSEQNVDLKEENNKLIEENKSLLDKYNNLIEEIEKEYPNFMDENTGEIIDSRTVLINYDSITDEDFKNKLDKLSDTVIS